MLDREGQEFAETDLSKNDNIMNVRESLLSEELEAPWFNSSISGKRHSLFTSREGRETLEKDLSKSVTRIKERESLLSGASETHDSIVWDKKCKIDMNINES